MLIVNYKYITIRNKYNSRLNNFISVKIHSFGKY